MASPSSDVQTATTHPFPAEVDSPHDSARGSPDPPNCFEQLVTDINAILGPCNGIDSAGVDVEELKAAMRAYRSREEEWSKYAFADYSRAYTRNLVDHGNGKSNLVSLRGVDPTHCAYAQVLTSPTSWCWCGRRAKRRRCMITPTHIAS